MIGAGQALLTEYLDQAQMSFVASWRRHSVLWSALILLSLMIPACAATPCVPATSTIAGAPFDLQKFYATLDDVRAGKRTRAVTVLHVGDSHIALDHMTGVLRDRWQALLGDGGRGLPAGVPYPYYAPRGYDVSMNSDWVVASSLKSNAMGPFGMSGFRVETSAKGARMALKSASEIGMVEIEAYGGPRSGSVYVQLGTAAPLKLSTRANESGAVFLRLPAANVRDVTLTSVGDGPVALLGWAMLSTKGGVRYDSYGVSGATLDVVSHWDKDIVDAEIARAQPDLIMLGYGTNEGFNDQLDLGTYKTRYVALIERLERVAPQASIIGLGAFDGARRVKSKTAPDAHETASCEAGWETPPKLDAVRQVQREAMQSHGHGFVDLSLPMGGPCAVSQWVHRDPPMAWPDHVHLRKSGAETMGKALWQSLMQPFETAICVAPH